MNNYITVAIEPETQKILTLYTFETTEVAAMIREHPAAHKKIMSEAVADQVIKYFRQHQSGAVMFSELYLVGNGAAVVSKPNIAAIKKHQISLLYGICTVKCSEGLTSSVLGSEHSYPSQLIDQQNMQASTLVAMTTTDSNWSALIWCAPGDDTTWDMRLHTAQQIIALNAEYVRHIENTRAALRDKVAQINAISSDATEENAMKIRSIYW